MRTTLLLSLTCVLLFGAVAVKAQDEDRFDAEIVLFPARFDNFFQAPDGAPQEDVDTFLVETRIEYQLQPDRPLRLTAEAGYTFYGQGLDDSPSLGVGLKSEPRPQEWELELGWSGDRPVFDVGDEFDQADVLSLRGDYGYRLTDAWELHALGEWNQQEFRITRRKDNELYGVGGAVRYRGWGYGFSPEIGFLTGARTVDDPTEEHDQQDVWIKVRSIPIRPLYLSVRYRVRTRDYDTNDPLASNFQREDDRDQWTLAADYRFTDHLRGNLYVDYLDAESTKESRIFETTLLGIGMIWEP